MRSLRSVIFQRIVIVAVVSFLLSGGFTYYYYETILVKQMIHDDQSKLRQTARQLQYMSDDITQFASSLIISNQLQTFYKTYNSADTFDQFMLLQNTFNFLNDYKGLRKEVTSFALVMPSGETFWSESKYDDYFSQRMKEPWYQNFASAGNQTSGFTEPHQIFFGPATDSKTISYIVKVRNIEKISGSVIGELIVNLDYSDFDSQLSFGSADLDGLVWMNNAGHVLYQKKPTKELKVNFAQLLQDAAELKASETQHKTQGGYMLVDRMAGNGWKLVSFTSRHSLIERASIIIYLLGIFTLTSTALILLLMMPAIFRITRPIMQLYHAMNAASSGNLQTSVAIHTGDEIEKLGVGFNRMIDQLRVHLEETIRYAQEKKEMELELLLTQLNPHFVYNTLNAVIYMAQKQGNDDIVRMVSSFIRILQDAVKMGGAQSFIPLREDIALLRDYLAIQSYRYADMFEVEWAIDDAAMDCSIPRNLIQPFVENAIFHGICPKDDNGVIRLSATARDGRLIITIADDGIGIEDGQLASIWEEGESRRSPGLRHIGLPNSKQRIEHLFGRQAELRIDSTAGHGTSVTIDLPIQLQDYARRIG
ncbi:sensor histidine kinase [Paenibacillus sp. OV219]|uniref:sensor histidine kinase n=1 Tax=Paenibacillus sp. OV219 TaxID=1884377 RepID=UPI0008B8B012|nr:sensor histidine kinase [Paenibacillus sp. OV219]SEO31913.1 two-component system, sensor histidine kinase YesM [Paenibacillus sp. OV219]